MIRRRRAVLLLVVGILGSTQIDVVPFQVHEFGRPDAGKGSIEIKEQQIRDGVIKRAYQLIDDRDFGRAPAKLECFMTSPRRKLLSERCSGFTPEIAVTFPKRTFFPLEGYGWFLFRSVSYGLEHLPRS